MGFFPIRDGHSDVLTRSGCMYPTCTTLVTFPQRGRPASFCSRRCRKHYQRDRSWLISTVQDMENKGENDTSLYARLRWQLRRFPDLSESDELDLPPTPSNPLPQPHESSPLSTLVDPLIWALVTDRATARALAANRLTPPAVLDSLAQSPNPKVRIAVAANPQTATETLENLSKDSDAAVRTAAVSNPTAPTGIRTSALVDRSQHVRAAAAVPPSADPYEWRLANMRKEAVESADAATVLAALQNVLTDTLVTALMSDATETQTIHRIVGEALQALEGQTPYALSMAVESEITFRTFTHRLKTTHPANCSRPSPLRVKSTATSEDWADFLITEVEKCFKVDRKRRDQLFIHFTEIMAQLLLDDSGNMRSLYYSPKALVRRRS